MLENISKQLKVITDSKGKLVFFESERDVPFCIKRIYFVCEVQKDTIRGKHAHKKLMQLLWCPCGEIVIYLDDGQNKSEVLLNSPEKSIIVQAGIWHEMKWNIENSVLCVAASDYYDETDYIRSYEAFKTSAQKGYWQNGY